MSHGAYNRLLKFPPWYAYPVGVPLTLEAQLGILSNTLQQTNHQSQGLYEGLVSVLVDVTVQMVIANDLHCDKYKTRRWAAAKELTIIQETKLFTIIVT